MNKIKPEPCPICGGAAEVWVEFVQYSNEYEYDEKNLYHCGCKECELTRSCYWDKDQAIRWWNELAEEFRRKLVAKDAERRRPRTTVRCRFSGGQIDPKPLAPYGDDWEVIAARYDPADMVVIITLEKVVGGHV